MRNDRSSRLPPPSGQRPKVIVASVLVVLAVLLVIGLVIAFLGAGREPVTAATGGTPVAAAPHAADEERAGRPRR